MSKKKEQEDEQPLDPATEKVRVKLVRFGAVFMGLNILALMAVLGAIVYKIGGFGAEAETDEGSPDVSGAGTILSATDPLERRISLPENAGILAASMQENQVSVTLVLESGERELRVFSVSDGALLARFRFD
jgi:hypothetical protein